MFGVIVNLLILCKVTCDLISSEDKEVFHKINDDRSEYEIDRDTADLPVKRCREINNYHRKPGEFSDCDVETTKVTLTTRVPTQPTTTKTIIYPQGPLYNFLVNICKVILAKFSYTRIPKYFKVLNKSLRGLGSGYLMKMQIDKFCDTLQRLSDINGRLLKEEVKKFLDILTSGKPMIVDFFYTVNPIYLYWHDNKMDDYVYILKKYGQGLRNHIGDRTRDIFVGLVFDTYYKQDRNVQRNIKLKFTLAMIEYLEKNKNFKSSLESD